MCENCFLKHQILYKHFLRNHAWVIKHPTPACCNCWEIRLDVIHSTACSDVIRHLSTHDVANNVIFKLIGVCKDDSFKDMASFWFAIFFHPCHYIGDGVLYECIDILKI